MDLLNKPFYWWNLYNTSQLKIVSNHKLVLIGLLVSSYVALCSSHQSTANNNNNKDDENPRFSKPIENATAVLGRSAVLECSVENLGPYNKVAWLKMDSSNSEPTVLTIGTQTLFGENKYSVSQNGHRQWFLHIKHVRATDRSFYMCQVNAKNMISQVGFLDVQVPPIIIEDRTSSDTTVDEHHRAVLRCTAKGYPKPKISWRREDGQQINLGLFGGKKYSEDMGAYLCIAANGVPTSLSKRILLYVNFRPKIRVTNQLISARLGMSVELVCQCEAFPRPLVTWITPTGMPVISASSSTFTNDSSNWLSANGGANNGIVSSSKYEIEEEYHGYRTTMKLRINSLSREDFGSFKCLAKNTLGEKEGLIRLYAKANSLKSRKSLSRRQQQRHQTLNGSATTNDETNEDDLDEESFTDESDDVDSLQNGENVALLNESNGTGQRHYQTEYTAMVMFAATTTMVITLKWT
ncbi:hypothetical protein RDWZM_003356 [Blomia tropicalis]|uniref:Ig-like domain-containing protein n=1 Tax=Blomia tropicalis TaxID=40697 RepID=A0A9Q0RSH2_BLOTA|nr:hypothetical protein RDWZM_003356 [Blomia tropicalis]